MSVCACHGFAWRLEDPIQRFFSERLQSDFFQPGSDQTGELLSLAHSMLTLKASLQRQRSCYAGYAN